MSILYNNTSKEVFLERITNKVSNSNNDVPFKKWLHGNAHSNSSASHPAAPHNNSINSHSSNANNHANTGAHSSGHLNSHGNHGNHNNDAVSNDFNTSLTSFNKSVSGTHTQSISSIATSMSATKMGVYGSTGALTELKSRVATARANTANANMTNSDYTGTEVVMTPSIIDDVVKASYQTSKPKYYNGTIQAKANAIINGSTVFSVDTRSTNNDSTAPTSVNKSYTSPATPAGKTYTFKAQMTSTGRVNSSVDTSSGSMGMVRGSYITKAQIDSIVSKIKQVSANTVSSFGTMYYGRTTDNETATYRVTHSNHSSHSSSNPSYNSHSN